jgi:hypothetical protein
MWRKFAKSLRREMKYHFGYRWKVRLLIWNTPVNSNGGPEHGVDLSKVCASLAHQTAVCDCHELLYEVRNGQNFLSRVITGDEMWVYCYNSQNKAVLSVGKPVLSRPEESEVSQVKHQEHVCDFSLLAGRALLFIRNFFLQAKWLTGITTRRFSNV